jgi:DNA-binding transcriptional MerR regulator
MGDQGTIPGTIPPAAGEAPAGEAPEAKTAREAAAAVAAAAAPPARAAAPAKGAKAAPPAKSGTEIRMPSSAFRDRVDRDAAAKLKKALGMTLEEAQALLKSRKEGGDGAPASAAAAPAGAPAGAAAPARGPDPEKEKLRREAKDLERRLEAQRAKLKKVKTRERDRRTEIELRYSAVAAGIKADDADYAMGLYRSALRATAEGEDLPAPEAFWPTLKASKPYLFADGAPAREVPLRATTAPPLSRKPGEETPPTRAAGKPPGQADVDALEKRDFDDRTASRYGFRPPQSV